MARWETNPDLWKRVVPVAFHVDYWDGLGWPDRFARPEFTQRQHHYAAQLHQDSVYTPEFVVNGQEWRGWFSQKSLPEPGAGNVGLLSLHVQGAGQLQARFVPTKTTANGNYHLQVALLGTHVISEVHRGENEGRTLRHEFVVLGFVSVPMSKEAGIFQSAPPTPKLITADKPSAIAAWVTADNGTVIQATGGWLDPTPETTGGRGGIRPEQTACLQTLIANVRG